MIADRPLRATVVSDADLVKQVSRGQASALSMLYGRTVGRIFSLVQGIVRAKEDAEEVVCDVYVYAWKNASAYDSARCTVTGWLIVIAKARAIDCLRKRRRHVCLQDDSPSITAGEPAAGLHEPCHEVAQLQTDVSIHKALAGLSPLRRRLIELAFFQGLSHQEIAHVAELPLGSVKSHIRRGLSSLQSVLTTLA